MAPSVEHFQHAIKRGSEPLLDDSYLSSTNQGARRSVLRGLFDVVDHQDLDLVPRRFQLESDALLQGRRQCSHHEAIRIFPPGLAELDPIYGVFEFSREAGFVDDWAIQTPRKRLNEFVDRMPLGRRRVRRNRL